MAHSSVAAAFLALSLGGALNTWNAFAPASYTSRLFHPSFFASWLTIELPLHHLGLQAGATALFVGLGALDHWAGWLGLMITMGSWVGLIVLHLEGRRSRDVFERCLAQVASPNAEDPVPRLHVAFPLFFFYRRRGTRIERDVEYRTVEGQSIRVDIVRPRAPRRNRPALVQIHGGSWVSGDKREQGWPLILHLAANGWVCFNMNYRLGSTFPAPLVDLKHGISWIRRHASRLGVDREFIAVTGGSAGGHLATMLALTANEPAYQPGFEEADTSIQAAVPMYALYDLMERLKCPRPASWLRRVEDVFGGRRDEDSERFRNASPMDRVHPGAPPFLIVHGDRDTHAPVEEARHFASLLSGVSKSPVVYAELPGAQHAFDLFQTTRTSRTVSAILRFLTAMRERKVGHRAVAKRDPADPKAIAHPSVARDGAAREP